MSVHSTNIAVCKALGINTKGVTSIDIKMRPGDFPRMQITRFLMDAPIRQDRQQFELRAIGPAEPTPLDLDALCAKAMKRVHKTIERCAARHLSQMRECNRIDPIKRATYDLIRVLKGGAA